MKCTKALVLPEELVHGVNYANSDISSDKAAPIGVMRINTAPKTALIDIWFLLVLAAAQ
jgi:hypothetical protein